MKMFKKKQEPNKPKEPEEPEKRSLICHRSGLGWLYLDPAFERFLENAALLEDADEVIACLNDSPRFKKAVQAEAERRMDARLKELEAAVAAFKNAAGAA